MEESQVEKQIKKMCILLDITNAFVATLGILILDEKILDDIKEGLKEKFKDIGHDEKLAHELIDQYIEAIRRGILES